jgi:Spy/CpxP family protein refolding chaperone
MRSISLKSAALAVALVAAFCCSTAVAQHSQAQSQTAGQAEMRGEHAQSHLDWLSQKLNLTDEQKAKLQPIFQDEERQIRAVRNDNSLSQDQKREKIKQIHEANRPEIEAVLTPEQKQKLAQIKAEHKQKRSGDTGSHEQDESQPKDK